MPAVPDSQLDEPNTENVDQQRRHVSNNNDYGDDGSPANEIDREEEILIRDEIVSLIAKGDFDSASALYKRCHTQLSKVSQEDVSIAIEAHLQGLFPNRPCPFKALDGENVGIEVLSPPTIRSLQNKEHVSQLHPEFDIRFGSGGGANNHEANKRFLIVAHKHRLEFRSHASSSRARIELRESVVDEVTNLGIEWKKKDEDGVWVGASDEEIREKVRKALWEKIDDIEKFEEQFDRRRTDYRELRLARLAASKLVTVEGTMRPNCRSNPGVNSNDARPEQAKADSGAPTSSSTQDNVAAPSNRSDGSNPPDVDCSPKENSDVLPPTMLSLKRQSSAASALSMAGGDDLMKADMPTSGDWSHLFSRDSHPTSGLEWPCRSAFKSTDSAGTSQSLVSLLKYTKSWDATMHVPAPDLLSCVSNTAVPLTPDVAPPNTRDLLAQTGNLDAASCQELDAADRYGGINPLDGDWDDMLAMPSLGSAPSSSRPMLELEQQKLGHPPLQLHASPKRTTDWGGMLDDMLPSAHSAVVGSPKTPEPDAKAHSVKAAVVNAFDSDSDEDLPPSPPPRPKKKQTSKKRKVECTEREYFAPGDLDVLCARGGRGNAHPGNQRYLKAKEELQERYLAATKKEKAIISQELVDMVHNWGGKFLSQEKGTSDMWFEIDRLHARKKASQALRESNTPEFRAAKRAKYRN